MKKTWILPLALVAVIVAGCDSTLTVDEKQAQATEQTAKQANDQVGMPGVSRFTERKLMKRLYEMRDQTDLITYVYSESLDGRWHFKFKAMGFPLPYGAQFTNPEHIDDSVASRVVLPQPEPNGLFMPPTADGTWIMAIPPGGGEPKPVYCEPRIVCSPFPIAGVPLDPSK